MHYCIVTTHTRYLAPFLLVVCAIPAVAQPVEISLFGGMSADMHQASFSQLGTYASCCPEFEGGWGVGSWLGLGVELPLSNRFRIVPQITHAVNNGTMTSTEASFVADLRDTPRVRDALFRHDLDATISTIGLEPLALYRVIGGLDVMVGFRVAFVLRTHFTQTETLEEPDDYGTYLGAGRTWVNHEATIPDANPIATGLVAGLRYRVPLNASNSVNLSPEASYVMPMSSVTRGTEWTISSIRLGLSVSYALGGETTPDTIPADTIVPAQPEAPYPTIAMTVEGLVEGERMPFDTVRIEETRIIDYVPVLGHVYFETGSAVVPSRYLVSAGSVLHDSTQLTPQAATTAVLGIVAKRIQQYPGTRITLIGATSDTPNDKGLELARARAEAVKRALIDLDVPSNSIIVQAQRTPSMPTRASSPADASLAHAENQRVEIIPHRPEILDPLVLGRVHTTVAPDSLHISVHTVSSTGIVQCVATRLNGAPIALESNSDGYAASVPSPAVNQVYVAMVTDSIGRTVADSALVPVNHLSVERKRTERLGNAEVERYSLILFAFDNATVTSEHSRVLDRIRSRIKEGAQVHILGMTDVMGSSEYNLMLSHKRAEEVARVLGLDARSIQALGSQQPQYSNNAPEGRAYNRTVVIELRSGAAK